MVLACIMVLSLAGCRSQRAAQSTITGGGVTKDETQVVTQLLTPSDIDGLRAKITYRYGSYNFSGNLRMIRDVAIQMNVVLLGLKEVARVEIRDDGVIVIVSAVDQFCKVTYPELQKMTGIDVDFNMLQQLLWNRMFVPGYPVSDGVDNHMARNISIIEQGLASTTFRERVNGFRFQVTDQRLVQTSLATVGFAFSLSYDNFKTLVEGTGDNTRGATAKSGWNTSFVYPQDMVLSVNTGSRTMTGSIALSNFSTSGVTLMNTNVNGCTEVTAQQLFKSLRSFL